jgi:hypothetical protein
MNKLSKRDEELLRDLRPPGELSFEDVRDRLAVRERHPAIFRRFEAAHQAKVREAERRADAEHVWALAGGNPADFERHWRELSAQRKTQAIKSAEEQAEAASWNSTKAGF